MVWPHLLDLQTGHLRLVCLSLRWEGNGRRKGDRREEKRGWAWSEHLKTWTMDGITLTKKGEFRENIGREKMLTTRRTRRTRRRGQEREGRVRLQGKK